MKCIKKKNAQKVDYWVTVCESLGTKFNELFNLKNKALTVRNIPKYDNQYGLRLEVDEPEVFQILESEKNSFNLIYFGNYFKNDSGLESVLNALKKIDNNFKLILLGTDKSNGYFQSLISDMEITNQVVILKRIPPTDA